MMKWIDRWEQQMLLEQKLVLGKKREEPSFELEDADRAQSSKILKYTAEKLLSDFEFVLRNKLLRASADGALECSFPEISFKLEKSRDACSLDELLRAFQDWRSPSRSIFNELAEQMSEQLREKVYVEDESSWHWDEVALAAPAHLEAEAAGWRLSI